MVQMEPADGTSLYNYTLESDEIISVITDPSGLLRAGTGATVWDSSVCLAKYFEKNKAILDNKLIVELGCGAGLLGLVLAKSANSARIILTDQPQVIGLAARSAMPKSVALVPFDWNSSDHSLILKHGAPDLVIFADCITWPELYPVLIKTLAEICGPKTELIFANEKRDMDKEVEFYRQLAVHFTFSHIKPEEQHPEWQSEDIYMFRARKKPNSVAI